MVTLTIVFLAVLNAFLTARAVSLGQVYHDYIRSEALHQAFRASLTPSYALPHGCSIQTASARGLEGSWWVCAERPPAFNTIPTLTTPPPLPDFEVLLSKSTPCAGSRKAVENKRFDSPTAPFTCSLQGPLPSSIRALDNVVMDSPVFPADDSEPLVTIASPGQVTVSGELISTRDLLVVAGGNIRIDHLRNPGHMPIRATLISSRGDIEIDTVSGSLSLLVIGRAALRVPPTPFLPPFPLPRERLSTILGISPY